MSPNNLVASSPQEVDSAFRPDDVTRGAARNGRLIAVANFNHCTYDEGLRATDLRLEDKRVVYDTNLLWTHLKRRQRLDEQCHHRCNFRNLHSEITVFPDRP